MPRWSCGFKLFHCTIFKQFSEPKLYTSTISSHIKLLFCLLYECSQLVCLQLLKSYDRKEDCDLWKDGMFRAKNLRYICISRDTEVTSNDVCLWVRNISTVCVCLCVCLSVSLYVSTCLSLCQCDDKERENCWQSKRTLDKLVYISVCLPVCLIVCVCVSVCL